MYDLAGDFSDAFRGIHATIRLCIAPLVRAFLLNQGEVLGCEVEFSLIDALSGARFALNLTSRHPQCHVTCHDTGIRVNRQA